MQIVAPASTASRTQASARRAAPSSIIGCAPPGTSRPIHFIRDQPRRTLPVQARRVAFEKERGVTSVSDNGEYAYLNVALDPAKPRAEQELEIYRRIAARSISMNLLKLHRQSVSFVIDEPQANAVVEELSGAGFRCRVTPAVSLLAVSAAEMR